MKPLAIQALHFALVAIWFVQSAGIAQEGDSSPTAAPKSQYGGFASDAAGHQAYLDYLHGLETIPVEAGVELQQAIKAIPVESDIVLTSTQEAGLRDWLYDFLIAFSASGSDSLAAVFYLREGVNNPTGIKEIKKQFAAFESGPAAAQLKSMGIEMPEQPVDDTPFALFQAMHKFGLAMQGRTHFFGNISFLASKYSVFEPQGEYESYRDYAKTHGLLPLGAIEWSPKLRKEIEEVIPTGAVFAQFMFIAEEPEEFASFEGTIRHPFFARLVWNPEKNMWRLVEAFASNDAPVLFLFNAM